LWRQANLDPSGPSQASWKYSFYTIIVDGWEFGESTNTQKHPFVVDSGTTLIYLPPREHSPGMILPKQPTALLTP
jgi:hypothetical protein